MAKDGGGGPREALAELIHDAPCGIVLTDPDGRLLYVNETLNRWLGFPVGVTDSSRRLPDLMTMPGRLFYETHVAPMMRLQGFAREIACNLELENGGHLPVLVSGIARLDADGVPFRFDFTIFDAASGMSTRRNCARRGGRRTSLRQSCAVRLMPFCGSIIRA